MYSEHHSETALIIIADAEGKPIPVLNEFGISTVEINKVFQTNFSALNDGQGFWTALSEKEKAIAVKVALDLTYYLKGNRHPKVENPKNYRQLQFWYYHFYINEEDKASTDKELIAVHPFPMD